MLKSTHIKEQIFTKLEANLKSQKYMLYISITAITILLFALYKLLWRYRETQKRLLLGKKNEKHHKNMHSKLLKYSNDLEKEISKKTAELELNTYTHFLSALPNRNRLLEDSNTYEFKQMALLNIDKFQKFNDVYGEDIGNIALKLSADFLNSKISDSSTFLYHIGGDEFVIAVKDSIKLNNTLFIKKIEDILNCYKRESFIYEDKKFNFMMSAGLAFSGSKKMMAYADMALKDAKMQRSEMLECLSLTTTKS
ncbi:MAG: GGDEF domain-containing protein [Sulfurimonas sp.]|nr:GGDEF domain-containing protein [Sulfurimonas sp.]